MMVKSKRFKGVYVRKQKDGDISIYFSYKNAKGNLTYQKVGMKSQGVTEAYAYDKRSETVLLLKNGEIPHIVSSNKTHKTTLKDMAELYFSYHKTKSTEKRQRQFNNRIMSELGHINVHNITSKDIINLQKKFESDGLCASTVIQYTELISTIYNFYSKSMKVKLNNPTSNINKPTVKNRRERILTKHEIKLVYEEISHDFTLTLFFALALSTAARKSTILNYKVKDVNLQNKTLKSYDFKTESSYVSFLDDRTSKLLEMRMEACHHEPNASLVFKPDISNIGRWISREFKIIFDNLFNNGLLASDRQNRVVIHSLRHTVLSQLGQQGSNIFLLQKISNHKTLELVARYTKLAEDSGKNEIKNLWN